MFQTCQGQALHAMHLSYGYSEQKGCNNHDAQVKIIEVPSYTTLMQLMHYICEHKLGCLLYRQPET